VNLLLEYTLGVPGSYVNKDDNEISREFLKLKHDLAGSAPAHAAATEKLCDVCLNPFVKGENFCRICGRSANREIAGTQQQAAEQLDVAFDPNKVAFGQKLVDDALYGGIPKNSVVLITSPACEERDLILTRFIETGLDQSEIVVCASSDVMMGDTDQLSQNPYFYQVVCNPQAELVTSASNPDHVIMVRGLERLTELSIAFTTLLNNISSNPENNDKPKRLVLDIVSDTLLSNQSLNTRKWLRETITKFKVKNFTVLAMLNPHMHSTAECQALLDLFDGQIDIFEKESQGATSMCMRVKRLKNSRYSTRETILIRENMLVQNKD